MSKTSTLKRTSMSLDAETLENLEKLANIWNTSKSEVVRRTVRKAKQQEEEGTSRARAIEALEWFQNNGIGKEAADRMREEIRLGRQSKGF